VESWPRGSGRHGSATHRIVTASSPASVAACASGIAGQSAAGIARSAACDGRPAGLVWSRPEKWCIDHRVIRPQSYAVSDAGRAFSVPWSASGNLTGRTLARASRAHVAALLGPLLGLADEQRADEADDGSSVREDAHHIGAPADLLVQALLEGWYSRSGARAPSGSAGVTSGEVVY
jgi:hypothetical protein